jgi:predicted AAA+ superfamily ATPase
MLKKYIDFFAMRLQNIRMWIGRKYESTLKRLFEQFPITVITGARQVGKTSLVRKVFPDFSYVSLDVPSIAEQAEQNPATFLTSYQEPLIIDEVQYAPSLLRSLKVIVDKEKKPGRFVLTGSQNFLLMQGISESLAGRCGLLNMLNLSSSELRQHDESYNENKYLYKGGYPELYARPEIESHFWYAAYLATYLERDVRNILNVGSLRDFDRFLRAVAIRTAQILSYSELARDVGIAPNTGKQWISVLQASGQIFLLEPYHKNLGKRLIKSPKLYMCDTGLALFLMGFENWESVLRHPVVGAIWETHVIMQVVKHYFSQGKALPLWFWRTVYGSEVDLLIERGGRFIAIEAKFTETPDSSSLKGIRDLEKFYGSESIISGLVASRTGNPYPLEVNVQAVPGSLIDRFISHENNE